MVGRNLRSNDDNLDPHPKGGRSPSVRGCYTFVVLVAKFKVLCGKIGVLLPHYSHFSQNFKI